MPDREKVIKGLECCTGNCGYMTDCPYSYDCHGADPNGVSHQLLTDVLAMLKEPEPVKVHHLHGTKVTMHEEIVFADECGYCGGYLLKPWKACPICGRKVQWND